MKKKRLKKPVKDFIVGVAMVGLCMIPFKALHTIHTNQHKKALNEYKTCILKQHKENGYILRYACGGFSYEQYDKELNFKYKQVGYDLYLINK